MSIQTDKKILVAAVCCYAPNQTPPGVNLLSDSAWKFNIDLKLLGVGKPYEGLYRDHIFYVRDYLRRHSYKYMLLVDAKDCFFCGPLNEIWEKYYAFHHPMLFSAEKNCFPLEHLREQYQPAPTSYRYLNAGGLFVEVDYFLNCCETLEQTHKHLHGVPPVTYQGGHIFMCNQAAWSQALINGEISAKLDHHCEIFQTLWGVNTHLDPGLSDLIFENGRFVNVETHTRPCIIHANGSQSYWHLAERILQPKP